MAQEPDGTGICWISQRCYMENNFSANGEAVTWFQEPETFMKKNELTKVMYGGKWILEIAEVRAYLIHFTKSMQHEGRAVVQLILH